MALIDVVNLNVKIPIPGTTLYPVRNVSFSLDKGKTLGLVGESGCGKSLTALALIGLLPKLAKQTADILRIGGRDLTVMSEMEMARQIRGNKISMIFQEPMTSLNPVHTIGRQLTETMLLHRSAGRTEARGRAVSLLNRVGIPKAKSRLGQYPHQLSGGLRQRVMIAMALMNEPDLIIADEPTTALDVTIQAEILRLLAEIQKEMRMAMLLITHNLGVVARVADHVAVMYAGEIVETGSPQALFSDPRHPYTLGLLASIPQPGRLKPGSRMGSIRGMVPSLIGEIKGCAFANRCDYAREACYRETIQNRSIGPDRSCRCILDDNERPSAPFAFNQKNQPVPAAIHQHNRMDKHAKPILSVQNVKCVFIVRRGIFSGKRHLHAVNGVTVEIKNGETLALVGESGCGKTTLGRILLGIQNVNSGQLLVDGVPQSHFGQKLIARRIQPIFQDPYSSLNPRKTIGQIIQRPLDIHQVGLKSDRKKRVEEMLEIVGLPKHMIHQYPNQLSGGQRQRVAIARAIIMKPELVICDEPTSALDVSVQAQIMNLLLDLRSELNLSYLLITHDLSVVQHMASRIAVMYLGEIMESGVAEKIFATPRHPYTRALLDSMLTPVPGAGIPDNRIGQNFPNPLDLPRGCKFHPRCPECMPLCRRKDPPVVDENGVEVRCHLFSSAGILYQKKTSQDKPPL